MPESLPLVGFLCVGLMCLLACLVGIVWYWTRDVEPSKLPEKRFRFWMMAVFAVLGWMLWTPTLWWFVQPPFEWAFVFLPVGLGCGLFVGYWVSKLVAEFLSREPDDE